MISEIILNGRLELMKRQMYILVAAELLKFLWQMGHSWDGLISGFSR